MKYWVIDTESLGVQVDKHDLTEISIIRCEDLVQKNWYLKPKRPENADPFALTLTNKTIPELMSRNIYLEDVIDEIDEFLKGDDDDPDDNVMIAHNASFDRRMVEHNWKILDRKFPANYWLDTVNIAKKYARSILKIDGRMSFSQANMIELLDLKSFEKEGVHSAAVDARNLYRMWNHMTKQGKISNTEFIKISPDLDQNKIVKKSKKSKVSYDEATDILEDMGDLL